jgi:predicted glycogen debranching enzyme
MRFVYGKQDMRTLTRSQEVGYMLTNGLGGYSSVMAGFGVPRCDQGILVAAVKAPNVRINMVHRLREKLTVGDKELFLSTQEFADGTPAEDGYRHIASFEYETLPCWTYDVWGVRVIRRCVMQQEANTTVVLYSIENNSGKEVSLDITPFLKFVPRENIVEEKKDFTYRRGVVTADGYTLYIRTAAQLSKIKPVWNWVAYPEDAKDGRPEKGMTGACCHAVQTVAPGETVNFEISFSMDSKKVSGERLVKLHNARCKKLISASGLKDAMARQLVLAADAYIARRDSTNGKTILAGYPLFSDWGRDTMISLPGCCLSTGRYEDAKSILRTFLAYERNGLVPNLFPEGEAAPMYNTVDAALLLIDAVWQYYTRTQDAEFVKEAWPVMERIVTYYKNGTDHSISMDTDGLIRAGGGLDQVTWMDVRVNDILPTPRHGKPVEINAYWYNALKIMEQFAQLQGMDGSAFGALAEKVKASFVKTFYMEDKGYLKDVISGTYNDEQLRCNQIWAVSMPFTMLSPEQERSVVDTVRRHLYTPCGLRTLSPEDPEYHPNYGGDMVSRDMAYHQGTTWVFPMGGYYLAYLKTYGKEAAGYVRSQLNALEPMLREGCAGQLPEIYEGDFPTESKGCFGQAWSVGEMLRVFEAIEKT